MMKYSLPISSVFLLCCTSTLLMDFGDASSRNRGRIDGKHRRLSEGQSLLPYGKAQKNDVYAVGDGYNDADYPVGDYGSISAPDLSPPLSPMESPTIGVFPVGVSGPATSPVVVENAPVQNNPTRSPSLQVSPMPGPISPSPEPTRKPSSSKTPAPASITTPGPGSPSASNPTPGVDGSLETPNEGTTTEIEDESSSAPFGMPSDFGTESPSASPNSDLPGASTDAKSPTISPMPSAEDTLSLTAEFCSGASPDKSINVRFVYALEFEAGLSEQNKTGAVSIMELKLVSDLLDCDLARRERNVRGRELLSDGVAGLDYKPEDTKRGTMVCPSGGGNGSRCDTYNGIMTLFLEQTVNGEAAKQDLLFGVRDTMQKSDFPQVDGIVAVWYLEPELSDVSGIEDDTGSDSAIDANRLGISAGVVVAFAALGVFVFAALTLAVYRFRGNRHSQEDGALTIAAGSDVTGIHSHGSKSTSSFSAMLPQAYRMNTQDTMSAILEVDSDSDSRAQSSVIVSDGGYTSDGDSLQDSVYTSHIDPVLGAQKVDDDNLENDRAFLFESDLEDTESIDRALTSASTGPDDLTVLRGTPTKHQKP